MPSDSSKDSALSHEFSWEFTEIAFATFWQFLTMRVREVDGQFSTKTGGKTGSP